VIVCVIVVATQVAAGVRIRPISAAAKILQPSGSVQAHGVWPYLRHGSQPVVCTLVELSPAACVVAVVPFGSEDGPLIPAAIPRDISADAEPGIAADAVSILEAVCVNITLSIRRRKPRPVFYGRGAENSSIQFLHRTYNWESICLRDLRPPRHPLFL